MPSLSSSNGFFNSLAKSILLLTFVTYYSDRDNAIAYHLLMTLPKYFLPIFPAFSDYLNTTLVAISFAKLISCVTIIIVIPRSANSRINSKTSPLTGALLNLTPFPLTTANCMNAACALDSRNT